jgi:hypothetical protein
MTHKKMNERGKTSQDDLVDEALHVLLVLNLLPEKLLVELDVPQ